MVAPKHVISPARNTRQRERITTTRNTGIQARLRSLTASGKDAAGEWDRAREVLVSGLNHYATSNRHYLAGQSGPTMPAALPGRLIRR